MLGPGGSGIAEVLPAGRPVSAEALPQERVLYLTDVERTLLVHVGEASEADSVGKAPELALARQLGASEVRLLPVPLADTETEKLACLPEQIRRLSTSAENDAT